MDWEGFEKAALEKLKEGEKLGGKDGVMAPLIKHLLETALGAELEEHLEEEKAKKKKNRKNGKGKKGLKTSYGKIELETSRDRAGSFEPKIVKKRETTLGEGLDNQVISMYSRGMSYEAIRVHFEELYGLELSKAQISGITDKVWTEITAWQNRPLEKMYPIIWMDALHYKVREEGRIVSKAVYVVLGVDKRGQKDLLALHTSENEGAKFWLQVLTDLQNRGIEDILIACIDNLSGFSEAIGSIFPKTEVQLCVVHQIRNSLNQPIRKVIYTTNTVEGFNRQLRKITKTKAVFPNEDALLKLVWLVAQNILKKWTSPLQKWALTAQQLYIHFPDRFEMDLNMGDGS